MTPAADRCAPLTVEIRGGRLVISIGVETLAAATEGSPKLESWDEKNDDYLHPTVTDPNEWAKEVMRQLHAEEEDGTTPLHKLFDQAFMDAIEDGAEGCEVPEGWNPQ